MAEEITFKDSSGNVFADFGVPDADEHLAKADLAHKIRRIIQSRGLTQVQAAQILGTIQARISDPYNAKVARMSFDRLLRFLAALDYDVSITVTAGADSDGRGRTLMAARSSCPLS